jgi:hypothetical protein
VPKADPYEVLGVRPGASPATIKAAWRKLAREHHPDVKGSDAASLRAATRRMVQINAAYETLRSGATPAARNGSASGATETRTDGRPKRPGGPPPPKPTRPVTGRLDTAATFRARNRTTTPPGARHSFAGHQPPPRPSNGERELRASDPSGPLRRGRLHRFRAAPAPELPVAAAQVVDFGKFHGHTLGEIARFEPSYIDWIASTITRDAALVAAARVVREDLDRRGVSRQRQVTERQRRDTERQRQEWMRIFGSRDGE